MCFSVASVLRAMLLALVVAAITFASPTARAVDGADPMRTTDVKRPFADVRTDLQNAIINEGLTIDYNGKIGDMLKRTAADVGAKGDLYEDAQYFTFCSSRLSRAMMDADPGNIGFCPYMMFLYQKVGSDVVSVGYKLLPMRGDDGSQKALAEINALLDKILKEATE